MLRRLRRKSVERTESAHREKSDIMSDDDEEPSLSAICDGKNEFIESIYQNNVMSYEQKHLALLTEIAKGIIGLDFSIQLMHKDIIELQTAIENR